MCGCLVREGVGSSSLEWHEVVYDELAGVEVGQCEIYGLPADVAGRSGTLDGGSVLVTLGAVAQAHGLRQRVMHDEPPERAVVSLDGL